MRRSHAARAAAAGDAELFRVVSQAEAMDAADAVAGKAIRGLTGLRSAVRDGKSLTVPDSPAGRGGGSWLCRIRPLQAAGRDV